MIIQCSKCLTKFKMDDSKVKEEGTKVRCAKCKEVFLVTKEQEAPAPPPMQAEASEDEDVDFSFPETKEPSEESRSGSDFGMSGGISSETPSEKETDFSDWGIISREEPQPPTERSDMGEREPSEFKGLEMKEELEAAKVPNEEVSSTKHTLSTGPDEGVILSKDFDIPQEWGKTEESAFESDSMHEITGHGFPEAEKKNWKFLINITILSVIVCSAAAFALWFLWTNYSPSDHAGEMTLESLSGDYARNIEAGDIFIISGRLVNNTNKARGFFKVRGTLFGSRGEKLMQSEVYCGNELTAKEISTFPKEKLLSELRNRAGKSSVNVNLAPGNSVRFMIVFLDLPSEMKEFSVEIADSQLSSE